jgi:hypothetical protein
MGQHPSALQPQGGYDGQPPLYVALAHRALMSKAGFTPVDGGRRTGSAWLLVGSTPS